MMGSHNRDYMLSLTDSSQLIQGMLRDVHDFRFCYSLRPISTFYAVWKGFALLTALM